MALADSAISTSQLKAVYAGQSHLTASHYARLSIVLK